MLSILIGHSYFLRFDPKQAERCKPYPPLATLHVAALLRSAGHSVTVFDAMLSEGVAEFEAVVRRQRPQVVLLYEDNYNFLSKMCLAKMREAACRMIAISREVGARILTAGSDASDSPEPYLQAGADLVLLGEGLATLLEIIPRLSSDPQLDGATLTHGLSGIAWLEQEKVRKMRGARTLDDPRLADLPARDLVDIASYRSIWQQAHGYFSLNMVASRGCPFRCTWCAKPIWGNQYLQRTPAEVAAEMLHIKRAYAPDHIWFADDIFGFRVDWLEEFARQVRESGGQIPFMIQTRADLLSENMAQALADAGCREAWIGAESGSQRILDAMRKGTTVNEILTARERLRTAGIRVGFFIQLGYLGEELEDIVATRELLRTAQPDDVGVSVAYPLPGTKFYELVREQLRSKTHWQDSDDLSMMFRGTYTSEFYREIRNLLHEQVLRQTSDSPDDERGDTGICERRWQALMSRELEYRSPDHGTKAVV